LAPINATYVSSYQRIYSSWVFNLWFADPSGSAAGCRGVDEQAKERLKNETTYFLPLVFIIQKSILFMDLTRSEQEELAELSSDR